MGCKAWFYLTASRMGVTGLLPILSEIQQTTTLAKYRGKTLAIDTYGWLHRGLVSCAQDLCQDVPTRKYITYVTKKVEMLRHFGVEPYLVFDGAYLPTKAETARERREKRDEARRIADDSLRRGDRKTAWKQFMKAAGVTHEMAKSVMVEMDALGVKYVVAPYEADPQMVYLEKIGLVDGILSEDSDLLVFGCQRLITKLKDTGACIEINRHDFHKVRSVPGLGLFTQEQLRVVAMLSGCDYTKGVPGVGPKTAFAMAKRHTSFETLLLALRAEGKKIDDAYEDEVHKANLAFQFQKVFDPRHQRLTTLNEYPDDMDLDLEVLESCCGRTFDDHIQTEVCKGSIHPNTHETLVAREQSLASLKSKSFTAKPAPAVAPKPKSASFIDSFFKTTSTLSKLQAIVETFTVASKVDTKIKVHLDNTDITPPKRVTEKLSPTSRKVRRIVGGGSAQSKFFSKRPEADPNSSVMGDSDVPESSPVKVELERTPLQTKVSQIPLKSSPEAFSTKNVLDALTDDDSEIEESPVKTKLAGLRLRFANTGYMSPVSDDRVLRELDANVKPVKPVKPVDAKPFVRPGTEPAPRNHVDLRKFAFSRN